MKRPLIRQILVAVKELHGRPLPAVLKAAQLARAYGAKLELFHALSSPLYVEPTFGAGSGAGALEQTLRQNARRRLEAIADRLRVHGIKVTVCAEWDYPSHEAIIRRARAVKADLIVAALHAGKHRVPWLLRLTDWEILRWSEIPVLLVKNPRPYRHPAIVAAIDPGRVHDKPQQLDKDILRFAKSLADTLSGPLHAVHAYDQFPVKIARDKDRSVSIEAQLKAVTRHAGEQFSRALRSARVARSRQYLIGGDPVDAIVEAVLKSHGAIAVMGTLSRTGYKRLLFGDTAERVLDVLSCDILAVKPPGFSGKVPRTPRKTRVRAVIPVGMLGG